MTVVTGEESSVVRSSRDDATQRTGDPSRVHWWLIDLDATNPHSAFDGLSGDERAQAARFAFDRDRRRYLAAHIGLRQQLASWLGVPCAGISYARGHTGKPFLTTIASKVEFNLSHSDRLALIGLSAHGAVGVDVEIHREIEDLWPLARTVLSMAELGELRAAPSASASRMFLRGWTRKEACLKAVGFGLTIDPCKVEVGLDIQPRTTTFESPAGVFQVQLESLDFDSDWHGAIANVLEPIRCEQ